MKNPDDVMRALIDDLIVHNQPRVSEGVKQLLAIAVDIQSPYQSLAVDYCHLILLSFDRFPWAAEQLGEWIQLKRLEMRPNTSEAGEDELVDAEIELERLHAILKMLRLRQRPERVALAAVEKLRAEIEDLEADIDTIYSVVDAVIAGAEQVMSEQR